MTTYYCGCRIANQERKNPSTGDRLLLCESHANLHDWGHGFDVYPRPYAGNHLTRTSRFVVTPPE